MLKSFLRDSLIYTLPAMFSRGVSFFLLPLYARFLTPEEYGVFDLVLLLTVFVSLTVALEITQAVARFYAAQTDLEQKKRIASAALYFALASYLLFTGLVFAFSDVLAVAIFGHARYVFAVEWGAVSAVATSMFYFLQNQLKWELRAGCYARVGMGYSAVLALAVFYFLYVERAGLEGALKSQIAAAVSAIMLACWYLRHSFTWHFSAGILRKMLGFSFPLVFSSVGVFLSNYIDRVMVAELLGLEALGIYAVTYRIAAMITLVLVGFQSALTPLVYANYEKDDTPAALARIFKLFLALVIPMMFFVAMFSSELVWLLSGDAYKQAATLIFVLMPAVVVASMYIFFPGMGIAKKTSVILVINVTGAGVNVVLNLYLIPVWELYGAAVATLASSLYVLAAYFWQSQKRYPVPYGNLRLLLAVCFFLLCYGGLFTLQPVLAGKYGVSVLAVAAFSVLFLSLLASSKEWVAMVSLLAARLGVKTRL